MPASGERFDLWPRPYWLKGFARPEMRINKDIKKSVVFLGHGEGADFKPAGTGFYQSYGGAQYLVTVKHVAKQLGDSPFEIRMNCIEGDAGVVHFDPHEDSVDHPWFTHEDATVDLAIMPINKDFRAGGYDRLLVPDRTLDWEPSRDKVGLADECYAIGLFARFSGRNRNVPVVHVGHIASFGDGERITVRDRCSPKANATIEAEGYLVELTNLPGLSGAPVFARPTIGVDFEPLLAGNEETAFDLASQRLVLLGVWSGSWDGYSDEPVWRGMSVPVGMGFVTPFTKLKELLESEPVAAERARFLEWSNSRLAAQQDVEPPA